MAKWKDFLVDIPATANSKICIEHIPLRQRAMQ